MLNMNFKLESNQGIMPNYQAFLTSFEKSRIGDSKYYNMIQFIEAASVYIRTRSEESANFINRHLQLLSVTTDYTVFDTNTSVVCEFFVSLHELLTSLEPRSSLAWCCINVLSVACFNPTTRYQLIHTYQFLPGISRLLGDHLSNDKKLCLLTVMQELSCGIKICWQIPYLTHLMTTLIRWIEKEEQNDQITMLSLSVLVNLCYKNLPAIYTLSKCRDIKSIVRICSKLKEPKMELNFCVLLIILDYKHGIVPNEVFLKLTKVTFQSIKQAFKARDQIQLRHIVELFLDIKNQNASNHDVFVGSYVDYHVEVEKLMDVVDQNSANASGDATQCNQECISSIFKFLQSLVELKLLKLIPMYPCFVELALRWIQTEYVCSEALLMLMKISLCSNIGDQIFEPLLNALPILTDELQGIEEDTIMSIEQCKRLSSIVQLLRALVLMERMREPVLSALNEEMINRVFMPLIGIIPPRINAEYASNFTPEAILLYVNTLVLLNELARFNSIWVSPLSTLLEHGQIHAILAQALYSGNEEIRALILCMAAFSMFPRNQVAVAMYKLQPFIESVPQNSNKLSVEKNLMCYPVMSTKQSDELDETICILKEALAQRSIVDIPPSEVMEMCEYKLASMDHAQRAAITSEEAASLHCSYLQQQTAQRQTEILRIRQLFIHTQRRWEELNKSSSLTKEYNRDLTNRLEAEKGRCKVAQKQLNLNEEIMAEKEGKIEDLTKQLKERVSETGNLEESNTKLKGLMYIMEENLEQLEKNAEKKEEFIMKANATIEHFKLQVVHLERQLKLTELELKSTMEEHDRVNDELMQKSQLINTIISLTNSK